MEAASVCDPVVLRVFEAANRIAPKVLGFNNPIRNIYSAEDIASVVVTHVVDSDVSKEKVGVLDQQHLDSYVAASLRNVQRSIYRKYKKELSTSWRGDSEVPSEGSWCSLEDVLRIERYVGQVPCVPFKAKKMVRVKNFVTGKIEDFPATYRSVAYLTCLGYSNAKIGKLFGVDRHSIVWVYKKIAAILQSSDLVIAEADRF
jgi:hypothetical protein